jgi:hypothetical protein
MKLIDKAALVAEIEKLMNRYDSEYDEDSTEVKAAKGNVCHEILCTIDSIETKELDLEKSISDWLWEGLPNDEELIDYIKETAEHFFELGLSVSNSTKVTTPDIDDVLKENGVNPDSKEAKIIKESYFMAIEKLAQKGEEV